MKIKMFATALLVAVVASFGLYTSVNKSGKEVSDLMLENIQALAVNETDASKYCEQLCMPDNAHFCYIETTGAYIYCMNKFPKNFY